VYTQTVIKNISIKRHSNELSENVGIITKMQLHKMRRKETILSPSESMSFSFKDLHLCKLGKWLTKL